MRGGAGCRRQAPQRLREAGGERAAERRGSRAGAGWAGAASCPLGSRAGAGWAGAASCPLGSRAGAGSRAVLRGRADTPPWARPWHGQAEAAGSLPRSARPACGQPGAKRAPASAGSDVSRCVQRHGHRAGCHRLASYKLLKEVTLLQRLDHPGVVKLHGQCNDNSLDPEIRVIAMLELGSPLEMIQLLQTPWEERFKICLSLVKLLFYLAHSPLGSIVLLDFQPR